VEEKEHWDLTIEPSGSIFKLNLKDVWRYRDLLLMFVKRDYVSFYKQTILGPLWFFIQPALTTLVYSIIFGGLAQISTDGLPRFLFYLSGITAWNYFADCIIKTSTVFKDNANIFGKVYFPRLIMPLSIVLSNLVKFFVQIILLLIAIIYYKYFTEGVDIQFTSALLIFPLLVLIMAILGLGIGLIISSLTTKYRDLSFLVTFGVQLLMYATTVIYPLSFASAKFRPYIEMNPMTSVIEAFRYSLLGRGEFQFSYLMNSLITSIVILVLGVIVFNKTEKDFVDTI
jgi:lipopolysaccharide transport system permease protein